MPFTPTRLVLAAALLFALGFAWRIVDRDVWRARLAERFIAGLPWGTLVTVAIVVGFYLVAQSGLTHPDAPVVYAFVSWSYLYPTGILTAGIAHGGPGHIVSNVTGTLVLAPIVEYVWSHYPGGVRRSATVSDTADDASRRIVTDGGARTTEAADTSRDRRLRDRPWVRAVVVFPAALLSIAFLTAAFSLGPGLGFSGALYAIVGFAVVTRPLATVLGVVATSAVGTVFTAFTNPIVREAFEAGPPAPPGWAGVGFQAHLLGFLLGVLLAVALLAARGSRPRIDRVLAGTLLVGIVQSVWLVTGGGGDEFVLYRGAGVAFLFVLAAVVTTAVAGSARPLIDRISPLDRPAAGGTPRPIEDESDQPIETESGRSAAGTRYGRRTRLAVAWLTFVVLGCALGAVASIALDGPIIMSVAGAAILALVLSLPALPAVLPRRIHDGPLSRRGGAVVALLALTVLISLPMAVFGLIVIDQPSIEGSQAIEIRDYTVAYVADEPAPRSTVVDLGDGFTGGTTDGVVVASDAREIWTVAERPAVLAHEGTATVVVGGVGWREEVAVDRAAWDVVGNETAYAVDLEHDGESVRSYVGDAVRSASRLDGHHLAVVPTETGFEVRATAADGTGDDERSATVPEPGEETSLGEFRVRTEAVGSNGAGDDADARLVVEGADASVVIAERPA